MQHRVLLSVAVAFASAIGGLAQDPTSSGIPLNSFIDVAHSAAAAVSSENAKQTSSSTSSSTSASSTSAAATSSPTAAAAKSSGSNTGLIVGLVVGIIAALLLGILITLLCCCLARRRRRRRAHKAEPIHDEEIKTWRSDQPANPGRTYSPPHQHNRDHTTEQQQPLVPNMAMAAAPNMAEHPAHRHENPFIPVPPNPRRGAPNSRPGLTDGTVPGADPYIVPPFTERNRIRGGGILPVGSRSRSRSNTDSTPSSSLPIQSTSARSTPPTQPTTTPPPAPLSGIGRPYEDMHVHVLQTDEPSRELRNSLQAREPIQRYTTPPQVPSRSPHRRTGLQADSYDSSTTNSGSGSGEDLCAGLPRWEQSQNRFSNSPTMMQAPPVPWEGRERRNSHSPRQSRDLGHQRMGSRSPATSINGQPRRLRFSDVQAPQNDSYMQQGYVHGVGEAM